MTLYGTYLKNPQNLSELKIGSIENKQNESCGMYMTIRRRLCWLCNHHPQQKSTYSTIAVVYSSGSQPFRLLVPLKYIFKRFVPLHMFLVFLKGSGK